MYGSIGTYMTAQNYYRSFSRHSRVISRRLIKRLEGHYFSPRLTLAQGQFMAITFMTAGIVVGSYLTLSEVLLPKIFAATSPWTQTDWSGGTASGTVDSDVTTYESETNVNTGSAGQITIDVKDDWYNESWQFRRKLTIDNTTDTLGVTSEELTDFPVLVTLDSDRVDYSETQDAGQDIRFTDSDGTTLLDYEIDTWNESGDSTVWVRVPTVDEDDDTDFIYVYYGNSEADDDQDAENVWDSNYKLVTHMSESSGTVSDSTSNDNELTRNNATGFSSGQIGATQDFNGSNAYFTCPANNFTSTPPVTMEAWAYFDTNQSGSDYDYVFQGSGYTSDMFLIARTNSGGFYYIDASAVRTGPALPTAEWIQITIVFNTSTDYVDLYYNGEEVAVAQNTQVVPPNTNCSIGRYTGASHYMDGKIDEIRWSSVARSAAWIKANYLTQTDAFLTYGSEESRYQSTATMLSNIYDAGAGGSFWGTLSFSTAGSGTTTIKVRTGDSDDLSDATDFSSCSGVADSTDLSATDCVTDGERYVQYQATFAVSGANTPALEDISIAFSAYDNTAPTTNASSIVMATASSGGRGVTAEAYNNATQPHFSWTAGADNEGGSGLKGYCVYLGTTSDTDPGTSGGLLTNSPVSTTGTTCGFIISGTTLDLTAGSYLSSSLSSGSTYYVYIKAIDQANNLFGSSTSFTFEHDSTSPTNVSYISTPGSTFSNVVDMSFTWPTAGGSSASDSHSGILGVQYQINDTEGTWKGTSTDSTCGQDYIPLASGSYTLTEDDDSASIAVGNNVVYFRVIDTACNTSTVATYRTGNLAYGGAAPSFETSCSAAGGVTVTPSSSETNSFALSWEAANPADGQEVEKYYYMVNTSPPSSLSTITSNTATYLDNGTTRTVTADSLSGAVKGSNTVYVVAVDDDDNYSASNCLKGTFTLDSDLPDPPKNLAVSDSSIKSSELWRASLGWDVPDYTGTGELTYQIQRSSDAETWTTVTTTAGTSYIDTVSDSSLYYWRVATYDSSSESEAAPSYANAVSMIPKGTYDTAPTLSSGPTVSTITTKKATVSWSTSRAADTKISYGTSSGSYFDEEPSKSDQVTDHSIQLTNLTPGTTYYYKAKWTDEDGNTGSSVEKTFTTSPAPSIKDVSVSSVGINTALITFTATGADSVKMYYGTSTNFGGLSTVSTSTSESTYTVQLTGLEDGTKYYYKLNGLDTEGDEYEGTTLDFVTLPRPEISNVRVQQLRGTAQSTVLVTWQSNTDISSIITYYPEGNSAAAKDEVNVTLKTGTHQMIIRGLQPQTVYNMVVRGRDAIGNEAVSDIQRLTTASDTRPPVIRNLKISGSNNPTSAGAGQDVQSQLVVSWNTDEPSTSQIEFGEGTGDSYSQSTQEDQNLTVNHLVVVTGLTPSKVYHLRAISNDSASNTARSIDTVTITPKATENALDLVVGNLSEAFRFLRGL